LLPETVMVRFLRGDTPSEVAWTLKARRFWPDEAHAAGLVALTLSKPQAALKASFS